MNNKTALKKKTTYLDDKYKAVKKSEATIAIVKYFDKDGKFVKERTDILK